MGRDKLENFVNESSCQTEVPQGQTTIAHGFNRGSEIAFESSPSGAKESAWEQFLLPLRGLVVFGWQIPQLKLWAIFGRAFGAAN
jgi:hypothetical protein